MTWTPEIKAACREHCACYGEPPCFEIDDAGPCDDCKNLRENPDWQTDEALK
jgi:hypothetical protein